MTGKKLLSNKAYALRTLDARGAGKTKNGFTLSGAGAYVLLDFGSESASGYTVFRVGAFNKNCRLRFSYSDRLEVFDYAVGRERGDFSRGAATYLGVELPVLPANPARFEFYTVCRTGTYTFPLLQGQHRFLFVTLLTEGAEVEINDLHVLSASCNAREQGSFFCSDGNLEQLWHIGARTVSIATVRARQIDRVEDAIALRALTKGKRECTVKGVKTSEWEAELRFSLSENPFALSGISLFLGGRQKYVLRCRADGKIFFFRLLKGECSLLAEYAGEKLVYDEIYATKLSLKGSGLFFDFRGKSFRFSVEAGEYSFGFRQETEELALLHGLSVSSGGAVLFDDYRELSRYNAFYGKWFVSDGAKRDRLPWSGDLEWAGKNVYYCFGFAGKMKNTLELLLRKQNPEGYFFAVTYPEDGSRPKSGDWGLYQSDIFSCWLTIVCYRYAQFTGDTGFLKKHYDGLKRSLVYLEKYIGEDGLFYQRYETSKGLWDNELGDVGKNTYANILISASFSCFSEIAAFFGQSDDAEHYAECGRALKETVEAFLFDEREGLYVKSLENRALCGMSSSLALALGFCDRQRALKIKNNYKKLCFGYGKILSLLIEGLYRYGYEEEAFGLLTGENRFTEENGFSSFLDWYRLCEREDCPHTVSECMLPPRIESETVECWGDRSHPDAAVSHILSGSILGVVPTGFGFGRFRFEPHSYGIETLGGVVPTPAGDIEVKIAKDGVSLVYPKALVLENAEEIPCVNVRTY